MSKRLIVALCLILVAFIVGTLSYFYLKNTSEKIIETAKIIEEKNLADEDFSENYDELDKLWKKHSTAFSAMLKHSDADVIERYFIVLSDAVKNDDNEIISIIISELCAFLRVTVHGESPRIENIF